MPREKAAAFLIGGNKDLDVTPQLGIVVAGSFEIGTASVRRSLQGGVEEILSTPPNIPLHRLRVLYSSTALAGAHPAWGCDNAGRPEI